MSKDMNCVCQIEQIAEPLTVFELKISVNSANIKVLVRIIS